MYSIEIEDCDGQIYFYGETFNRLVEAKRISRRLESEDAEIECACVVITETGELA